MSGQQIQRFHSSDKWLPHIPCIYLNIQMEKLLNMGLFCTKNHTFRSSTHRATLSQGAEFQCYRFVNRLIAAACTRLHADLSSQLAWSWSRFSSGHLVTSCYCDIKVQVLCEKHRYKYKVLLKCLVKYSTLNTLHVCFTNENTKPSILFIFYIVEVNA